jgi:hypothetical protein
MLPPCVSTPAFLMHPLLARLRLRNHQPRQWECESSVPDADDYVIMQRPSLPGAPSMPDSDWVTMAMASREQVLRCLEQGRVLVVSHFCALLDTQTKTLHHVDLVGELEGRPCLVLMYYTQRRIGRRNRQIIMRHMHALCTLCREHYSLCVTARAINVHFKQPGRQLECCMIPY